MTYLIDSGAYLDSSPNMAKAMASDCTGTYNIPNVWCDVLAVYTNHPYVTAFRGFGHLSYTFAIERTIDKLAFALDMDPVELRLKNAVRPGDVTPTQDLLTLSNIGNLPGCIEKAKELIDWQEGSRIEMALSISIVV